MLLVNLIEGLREISEVTLRDSQHGKCIPTTTEQPTNDHLSLRAALSVNHKSLSVDKTEYSKNQHLSWSNKQVQSY